MNNTPIMTVPANNAERLLDVRNLSVQFHTAQGPVPAVRNVSYWVNRGETVAILGESGSGKSVGACAIMNLIDTPPGEITSGQIVFEDVDLLRAPPEVRRRVNGSRIAMVFQDPLAALNPVYTIGWQIAEAFRTHPLAHEIHDIDAEVVRLLKRVGIPRPEDAANRYPHQFSGGQRQRIMIALALALKPALLIADEPTTALDVTVQAQILRLLRDLQQEYGMGLLLITHDLSVVADTADRVVVMYQGEVVESGNAYEVLHQPQHAYTQRLLSAAPGRKGYVCSQSDRQSIPIFAARNVGKRYGSTDVLSNVSLTLRRGETLGIVGESGSGKSTLARLLLGLLRPTQGEILFENRPLSDMSSAEIRDFRRKVQVVFQDPTASLNPYMRVEQVIAEPWDIHRDLLPRGQWSHRVAELLEQVGLRAEHANRWPHEFSGGQRQRIAIARALALNPQIILCDEAVSALDVSVQAQVIDLLRKLRETHGLSYIFIAHDLPVVRDFCDRLIVMQAGRIVEDGPTRQLFEYPAHAYTRELLAACHTPIPGPDPRLAEIAR